MKGNVIQLMPPPATLASDQAEDLSAAVREVSARVAQNNDERRCLHSRLDELRGLSPWLRRRRTRAAAPALADPITFYSIEEAAEAGPQSQAPARAAGGVR